ncbi:unnamed protein product [Durusdinium trenchii]|uniref:ATP-dependent DNA helicase n=1 Tax=Durusdinium trenchii TaxID=1381693 RepID=A0ABP0J1X5_9DINO
MPWTKLPHEPKVMQQFVKITVKGMLHNEAIEWVAGARIRPWVVVALLQHLIDLQHPMCDNHISPEKAKEEVKQRVTQIYGTEETMPLGEAIPEDVPVAAPLSSAQASPKARPTQSSRSRPAAPKQSPPASARHSGQASKPVAAARPDAKLSKVAVDTASGDLARTPVSSTPTKLSVVASDNAQSIARGNGRKFGLSTAGRRNALGTILDKREDPWLSGTMYAFTLMLFGNSHTAVNFRVPLTAASHDAECARGCLAHNLLRKLQRAMAQAARRSTRYFTGYLQKPQPLGRKELQHAAKQLHFLETAAADDPAAQQRKVAHRVLGDLEFRCSTRPMTEEFMLAGFEADAIEPPSNRDKVEVDTSWVSNETIHRLITGVGFEYSKRSSAAVHEIIEEWKIDSEDCTASLKPVNTGVPNIKPDHSQSIAHAHTQSPREQFLTWTYGNLTAEAAEAWLTNLQSSNGNCPPTAEQLKFLRAVIQRCLQEAAEEHAGTADTEPLRAIFHGVPGAGKSQTLKWLRSFFEDICHWEHQHQFVFVAPQNTQAALIGGVTLHAFANIRVRAKKASPGSAHTTDQFVKYQRLRWILVDETSTVGLEILATVEEKLQQSIRDRDTWKLRPGGEKRPFAGLNLILTGDLWQFPPGESHRHFPKPFRGKWKLSSCSWDFKTHTVECGQTTCADLHLQAAALHKQPLECKQCRAERQRRCLVGKDQKSPKFLNNPFVHGLNAAKYIAANLRARQVAATRREKLLWIVAQDTPLFHIEPPELPARRENWLQRHDQSTGGVVGLLPLLQNMPVRITQTLPELKPFGLFKNTRGTLWNWTLHEADAAAASQNDADNIVLQKMPLALYVHVPGQTWQQHAQLPPGVARLEAVTQTWSLETNGKATVSRRGFPLACDFAGTAHSFMGSTLEACTLDLGHWDSTASREAQLSGYMCLSRVRKAEDLCIAQPFSPNLFTNGELIGPHTFLEVHRGKLTPQEAKARFSQDKPSKKRNRDIMLFCRGCSPQPHRQEKLLPLREFVTAWDQDEWYQVLSEGMCRLCLQCKAKQSGTQPPSHSAATHPCPYCPEARPANKTGYCSECVKTERLACSRCDQGKKIKTKRLTDFDPEEVRRKKKLKNCDAFAAKSVLPPLSQPPPNKVCAQSVIRL